MNYKLINRTTGKETMCSKVVIDGFDYYVSDEMINCGDINVPSDFNRVTDLSHTSSSDLPIVNDKSNGYKKVIATNDPLIIDLPKVVENSKELALEYSSDFIEDKDLIDLQCAAYLEGYNKSQESHSHSDEDMIEFLKFHQKTALLSFDSTGENHGKSYKEILQIWKERKPKIVYYE